MAMGRETVLADGKAAGEASPSQGPPAAPTSCWLPPARAAGSRVLMLGINTRHCPWGKLGWSSAEVWGGGVGVLVRCGPA